MDQKTDTTPMTTPPSSPKKTRRPNSWLLHVKKFREAHPDMKYKEALVAAKATYHKKVITSTSTTETPTINRTVSNADIKIEK